MPLSYLAPEAHSTAAESASSFVNILTEFRRLRSFDDIRRAMAEFCGENKRGYPDRSISSSFRSNSDETCCGGVKVLCVWDVDDTLITSSCDGCRDVLLSEKDELYQLFERYPARHLLLSQGSVDDVFAPGVKGGRLQHLLPFFTGTNKTIRKTSNWCTKAKRSPSTVCCSVKSVDHLVKKAPSPSNDVPVIRISTAAALRNLKTGTSSLSSISEKSSVVDSGSCVRWLVLRPSLWGISLCKLSNLVVPSPHTAFLDGSVFRKMDIVRSLTESGLWDTVFFVDNNLTELGIVRPGLGLADYRRLRAEDNLQEIFLSDFLLLKASAALSQRVSQRGEDSEATAGASTSFDHGSFSHNRMSDEVQTRGSTGKSSERVDFLQDSEGAGAISKTGRVREDSALGNEKVVRIVVGHFHLNTEVYSGFKRLASPETQREVGDCYHPAFSTSCVCRDDQLNDVLEEFLRCEEEFLRCVRVLNAFPSLPPAREPCINYVRHLRYVDHTQLPPLRDQYRGLIKDIMKSISMSLLRATPVEQDHLLKRDAAVFYDRLIREQPIIDPFIIDRVALLLFYISTTHHHVLPSTLTALKRELQLFMGVRGRPTSYLKRE
uniref:Uncharacterized protein TCIL3000_11_15480 n=1 Tax=Trypanosoma congolense (strain IL3000) TaxID=1068625 RepID=G0V306_TRYCI|nr:unnamed protein product [Trypanosoma congolense IL3000]